MTAQLQIMAEIIDERKAQDKVWGPVKDGKDIETMPAVLMEEVGEVARAHLQGQPFSMRAELIQVAAVAVKWIEWLDLQ